MAHHATPIAIEEGKNNKSLNGSHHVTLGLNAQE